MCIVHSNLTSKAGRVEVPSTSGVGNSPSKEQVYVKAQVLAHSYIQLRNIFKVHVGCGTICHTIRYCLPSTQ